MKKLYFLMSKGKWTPCFDSTLMQVIQHANKTCGGDWTIRSIPLANWASFPVGANYQAATELSEYVISSDD